MMRLSRRLSEAPLARPFNRDTITLEGIVEGDLNTKRASDHNDRSSCNTITNHIWSHNVCFKDNWEQVNIEDLFTV